MGFVVAPDDVDGFKEGTSLVDKDFKVGSKGLLVEICNCFPRFKIIWPLNVGRAGRKIAETY